MLCPPLLGSVLITLPSGTWGWAGPEPRTGPSSREGEGASVEGAARPGRPAAAQRAGGGEGGAVGPARASGLRKRPVGTSGAWPLQSPRTGARAKAGSCLVPLFCRKKLGTETRAATLSHVGVLHLQAAHPLVGRQGSRVSMRVARGSASLLPSHGRGIWPRDVLKEVSRGLSRVEAGNPGFPRLVQVTSGGFSWWL